LIYQLFPNERISLKSIRTGVKDFVEKYEGSEENKYILSGLTQFPNFLELVVTHENSDIQNQGEDILNKLLIDITGLLVGVPNSQNLGVDLYYYDKARLIELAKTPGILKAGRSAEAQTISYSAKILKMGTTKSGFIQFPIVTQEQYAEFLIGNEKTKEIVNIFNTMGEKYGVPRLGDNIPQDIIRDLSKNERFKLDIRRILK